MLIYMRIANRIHSFGFISYFFSNVKKRVYFNLIEHVHEFKKWYKFNNIGLTFNCHLLDKIRFRNVCKSLLRMLILAANQDALVDTCYLYSKIYERKNIYAVSFTW